MNPAEQKIYDLVRAELNDSFVPEEYRGKVNSRFCEHCHHATIAIYYLLGGKESGYKVRKAIDELQIEHYWLETSGGEIIDPTAEQYTGLSRKLPYDNKVTRGVNYQKSKAAFSIISEMNKKIAAD